MPLYMAETKAAKPVECEIKKNIGKAEPPNAMTIRLLSTLNEPRAPLSIS